MSMVLHLGSSCSWTSTIAKSQRRKSLVMLGGHTSLKDPVHATKVSTETRFGPLKTRPRTPSQPQDCPMTVLRLVRCSPSSNLLIDNQLPALLAVVAVSLLDEGRTTIK